MKTLLLHIATDRDADAALQCALSLARAHGAHIDALQITPIHAYLAAGGLGGAFTMDDAMARLDAHAEALADTLRRRLAGEDVASSYRAKVGDPLTLLVEAAALADLIITSRGAAADPLVVRGQFGDLLYHSRTPLLLPTDDDRPLDPSGPMVIGWDGGYAAANAVRAAVPLLRRAASVRVVRIAEKAERFPSVRLLEYLSRHGVHAELVEVEAARDAIPDVLRGQAGEATDSGRPALLVIGGYSHHRAREFLFGGVTRALLDACPVPLFLAH